MSTKIHFKRLWVAFEEGPQVIDLNTMQPIVPPCENEQGRGSTQQSIQEPLHPNIL